MASRIDVASGVRGFGEVVVAGGADVDLLQRPSRAHGLVDAHLGRVLQAAGHGQGCEHDGQVGLDRLAGVVEDRPAGLLELYQGAPLTCRSTFYAGALPDPITTFPRCHLRGVQQRSEVVEQVRLTVIHKVGHPFGIGDARLRELGW